MKVEGSTVLTGGPQGSRPHLARAWMGPSSESTPPPASLVNADLLHLGDQHLEQPHDGLQRQLRLPGEDLRGGAGVLGLGKQPPEAMGQPDP